MKVKELINYVNFNEFYSLWNMKNTLYCDFLDEELPQKITKNLEFDVYRWYEISTSVYKLEDGFIRITGLSKIYNEDTNAEDCCVKYFASEY